MMFPRQAAIAMQGAHAGTLVHKGGFERWEGNPKSLSVVTGISSKTM